MNWNITRNCIIAVILLSGCTIWEQAPATPGESGLQTRVAQDVAATLTAVSPAASPTLAPAQPTDTPTPVSPTATPTLLPTTPSPPTAVPPTQPSPPTATVVSEAYVLEEEQSIGSYRVQLWRDGTDEGFLWDGVARIVSGGQTLAWVENAMAFNDLTGQDITGEGNPDVIIETYTGGAHCCSSILVYDLGLTLDNVLTSPLSNCGGRFEDLDGDGVYEFLTCDDLFAYQYCAYAGSPLVMVIMAYEPGGGYVPASPRFAGRYQEVITADMERAAQDSDFAWDGTNKCSVLGLVLDYLYTGQADQAWMALNQYYHHPDLELFWTEVTQQVAQSPLYLATGPEPVTVAPSYYTLQLLTSCHPGQQVVGLTREGQSPCDEGVPQRDIFWLGQQLRQAGLLTVDETLAIAPDGCTNDCRLDVVSLSGGDRLASIRLDTTVGFPGQVYRVNGQESAHFRLRGNLTWEPILP